MPPYYLRLRWPGIDDSTTRRTEPLGDGLARAVYAATRTPGDVVEVTVYTGGQSSELLMAAGDRTLEKNLPLIQAVQEEFPRTMGFELVTASQLGRKPATTVCLLGPAADQHVSPAPTALRRYLNTLNSKGVPYVVSTVVANDGTDRKVLFRVALYDPDLQWVSDDDYTAMLDDGSLDPATYMSDEAITSSWRLPLAGTWSVSDAAPVVGPRRRAPRLYRDPENTPLGSSEITHRTPNRRQLARSPNLFESLRERSPSAPQRQAFAGFDLDPWLTVDAETLPAFLEHVPTYYDRDPWPAIAGWKRFQLNVNSVLREVPGTEPATTADWDPAPFDPVENLDLEPACEHTQAAVSWFQTRGWPGRPRTFPSATFEVVRNGQTAPVMVVTEETLDAGALIALVSAAVRQDTAVYVVADSDATARTITRHLSKPFRETTSSRTRLYTTPKRLEAAGVWAVYPQSYEDPEWWLTPANILELWAGDDRLGRWPRTLETPTFIESMPHCRRDNDAFVVHNGRGDQLLRATTAEGLEASWRPLSPPVAPAFLATATQYATVLTPTAQGFKEFHHRPSWVDTDELRYQGLRVINRSIDRFLTQYTVPAAGDPVTVDALFPRLCTWIRTIDPYGLEFELTPGDVRRRLDGERQWRYPPHDGPDGTQ